MKLMVPAIKLKPASPSPDRQEGSQETVDLLQAIDALLAEASGSLAGPARAGSSSGDAGLAAPSSGNRARERAR